MVAILSSACAGVRGDEVAEPIDVAPNATYVYRCGEDADFVVRFVGDSVRLQRDLDVVVLRQAVSASGARYARDGMVFWDKGGTARIETPAGAFQDCAGRRAETPWEVSALLGYDFRAVGQEPGWMVEIAEGRRVHVLADYGEVEFFTSAPRIETGPDGATVHRADSELGEVVVSVREEACEDVMSGQRFPRSVTLALEGRVLEGCGTRLPGAPENPAGYRP